MRTCWCLLGVLLGMYLGVSIAKADVTILSEEQSKPTWSTLELQDTYLNYKNYLPNGYTPYLPQGSTLNKGLDYHIDTDVFKYFYWNNTVWSLMDQNQFRSIGWNYEVGARVLPFVDLEYEHFSRHTLDEPSPTKAVGEKYPVEDSINIKLYLYRRNGKDSIF